MVNPLFIFLSGIPAGIKGLIKKEVDWQGNKFSGKEAAVFSTGLIIAGSIIPLAFIGTVLYSLLKTRGALFLIFVMFSGLTGATMMVVAAKMKYKKENGKKN